jgi:hypothetical protein
LIFSQLSRISSNIFVTHAINSGAEIHSASRHLAQSHAWILTKFYLIKPSALRTMHQAQWFSTCQENKRRETHFPVFFIRWIWGFEMSMSLSTHVVCV